jgi:hypothetical protein
MNSKRKIAVVITARPSYSRIKTALQAIQQHPDLELQVIVSASALLERYGSAVNYIEQDGFTIAAKVFNVLEGENLTAAAKTTGLGILELSTVFDNLKPDIVVTIADRFETMATAIAASYMNIPLAHVQGGPITVTHPDITRYFMTIPEACQLVLEAGNMGNGGEIYIFDMGQSIRIYDLARKMLKLSGLKVGKDIQIVFTGLRPGEKLREELLADQESTIPTYHPKIMIAKVRTYDFDWSKAQVDILIALYSGQNDDLIVGKMKEIVPEFLSQNSVFEELDFKQKNKILDIDKHSFRP